MSTGPVSSSAAVEAMNLASITFRHRSQNAICSPIASDALQDAPRTRKSHRKSRGGCITCKQRRVKCDEERPKCRTCRRRNTPCSFPSTFVNSTSNGAYAENDKLPSMQVLAPAPTLVLNTNSIEATMIDQSLTNSVKTGSRTQSFGTGFNVDHLKLLKHFEYFTSQTFGNDEVRLVFGRDIPRLAVKYSYLMHAIICMSSLHVQFLQPDAISVVSKMGWYHWQQCLLLYRKILGSSLKGDQADAMLVTSTLISGIAFIMTDTSRAEESWPIADSPFDLRWLTVQAGIMLLLQAVQPLDTSSRIQVLFADEESTSSEVDSPWDSCEQHYLDLRNICIGDDCSLNNPYSTALQILAPLAHISCTADTVFAHLSFIASVDNDFISLLRKKDHKAILILAYWYAKMCTFDCWWITIRSKLECTAICMYLEKHAAAEIVAASQYPAQACGYAVKEHIQTPAMVPCMTM